MKKRFYYLYILFIPIAGISQQIDTTAIHQQIDSLLLVAEDYRSGDNFQEMHDIAESAVDIAERVLGTKDSKYANCLQMQAAALRSLKQYEEAKDLVEIGLNIYKINKRTVSADYAAILHLKGLIYQSTRNYDKAEPFMLEANSILGEVLGKDHLDYAESLSNIGYLYYYMGQYEKAAQFFIEALSVMEKILGKQHASYGSIANDLAATYMRMADYEKAELYYKEAISISRKIKGIEYTRSVSNLALLLKKMGQNEQAEALYLEVIDINEKMLGKANLKYALNLSNLAALYNRMGHYDKAEPLIIESKAIREMLVGKEHHYYATSLHTQAELNLRKGSYNQAKLLMIEANSILRKVMGKEHPRYAKSLITLAALYTDMGDYDKAESLYREAITICEKMLGKSHPYYVESLNGLALIYYAKKDYAEAGLYFNAANDINKTLLERAANHLSGIELQKYLLEFEKDAAQFASFIHQSESPTLAGEWYGNSLFYKGFLLGNALRIEQTASNASDSIQEVYSQWKISQRRLSAEYSKPITARKNIVEIEEKANILEKELLKSLPALKDVRRQVSWEEVRDQLKEGEAAIEFSHFRYFSPKATDSIFYMALVIRQGDSSPQPIFLFEEKEINTLLETKGARKADYANALYSLNSRGGKVLKNNNQKTLYELIWKPLEETLADIKTIYYAPSGLLHRINLGAIPLNKKQNLTGQYELVQMNCTRQRVIPARENPYNNEVILYGGIQYNFENAIATENQSKNRGGTWSYLDETENEVQNLEEILQTHGLKPTLFSGISGTEESFKQLGKFGKPSPRILHIATHGYFYPDPKAIETADEPELETIFKNSGEPMLRSGLILAGANQFWGSKASTSDKEDGILTALEISQMDLSHTELAVLSACETGLGEIQGNEGVYGLQRAFKIAGVKYLIMSLWQVPDEETAFFMTTLYSKMLEDKMDIHDAFRATQKELSQIPFFKPYLWAGFVLVE